ncbi:group III truncated hemoglobin [Legionella drancourtii]|uniref:Uncharacterized protein n=1 Tax=Legionella drancourtii LLAP12 TaxID=658187 RepID=G9EQ43_9GAMM|nr:group III truncated hemoglobin [Legionella drancourtii]EHL30618.1 hypothetical protein LDG_7388 [Legionella drancourtii LLAP12]
MTALTTEHIKKLVTHFYQHVQKDEVLSPVFNEVAKVDWEKHLPLLCQFWNSVMLKTNEYHGNAYQKHALLKEFATIKEEHFLRWLNLFKQEAIKHLPKEAAEEIIHRASLIAESLKFGMLNKGNQEE